MQQYDFIILGAGAAGLSLLVRLLEDPRNSGKKILLAERAPKLQNDRTWCFWEKEAGHFENIVHKKWEALRFESNSFSTALDMAPYSYKMIRGIDFYNHCFKIIGNHRQVQVEYGEIVATYEKNELIIMIGDKKFNTGGSTVFNSIYHPPQPGNKQLHFLQHFKGWMIETAEPAFDDSMATMMDFRVHQQHGPSFVYVLPLSSQRALVEYTLFTPQLLPKETYERELKDYIAQYLRLQQYVVKEEEFGIIPMTTASFPFFAEGMYHIGTAGGQTKASTGYTFSFIQKQAAAIAECLLANEPLSSLKPTPARFHFYDRVLLQVLQSGNPGGREVFTRLFRHNKASRIFRFLDNESSLAEELAIINSLPWFPFLKAATHQLFW